MLASWKRLRCLGNCVAGALLACYAAGSQVAFQFSAPISLVYGPGINAISNVVSVGATCTGIVIYNPDAAGPDLDPSPNSGLYLFKGTDMKMSLTVGTNLFSSNDSSSCNIRVTYQLLSPPTDGLNYEVNQVLLNGGSVPGATDSQTLDLALSTTNLDALASDALPIQPPPLSDFPFGGGNGYAEVVFYAYKSGAIDYGFSGTLTSLTPLPTLSAQLAGAQLVVSWPTNMPGFQLESTQTPEVANSWTAVTASPTNQNGALAVSLPIDLSTRFFRLKSP